MNDDDLIRRGDAIAACAVGPSDEWARATKSGYMQAATDCTFNVLRIPAAVSRAQRAALASEPLLDCRRWPFFPIEMPLTAEGKGPATIGEDASRMTYEVWDMALNTHSRHDFLPDAINEAMRLSFGTSLPSDPVTNASCRQPVKVKPSPDEHYDDYCIRQFAKLMSEKMAASRAKGRSGWSDPERCSIEYLRSLLYEHLDKGDPVDVANFCMMLRHYEASTYREFCNCTPQPSPDVAAKVQALVDAATKAKIILAEFEPHPLPVLGELLAALAAWKEG